MSRNRLPHAPLIPGACFFRAGWLLVVVAIVMTEGWAAPAARVTVSPSKKRQPFLGLGAGAMFCEGHVTSLAELIH